VLPRTVAAELGATTLGRAELRAPRECLEKRRAWLRWTRRPAAWAWADHSLPIPVDRRIKLIDGDHGFRNAGEFGCGWFPAGERRIVAPFHTGSLVFRKQQHRLYPMISILSTHVPTSLDRGGMTGNTQSIQLAEKRPALPCRSIRQSGTCLTSRTRLTEY